MSPSAPIQLFGHPRGIFILFLVEMWERFSYYGMRALLIFYLTQHFAFSDAKSTAIYGAYTALVYGSAVVGGWLADKLIGGWRSVVWGALLIMAGHLALIVEGQIDPMSALGQQLFYFSLALIITGTGLFKPNSTTLVGQLYPSEDSRRVTGFYIFYVGINSGAA
ncbi:MAG: oligopeptide:H+ symporter, partial [Pseudomonadota bacterium]